MTTTTVTTRRPTLSRLVGSMPLVAGVAGDLYSAIRLAGFEPVVQNDERHEEADCPVWLRLGLSLWSQINRYRQLQPTQAAHLLRWLKDGLQTMLPADRYPDSLTNEELTSRLREDRPTILFGLRDLTWGLLTHHQQGINLANGQQRPVQWVLSRSVIGTLNIDVVSAYAAIFDRPKPNGEQGCAPNPTVPCTS